MTMFPKLGGFLNQTADRQKPSIRVWPRLTVALGESSHQTMRISLVRFV